METKHTQGQWSVMHSTSHSDHQVFEVAMNKPTFEQKEANARLIESAPELLQALQDIVWLMTDDENSEIYDDYKLFPIEAINKARAAIKKANH